VLIRLLTVVAVLAVSPLSEAAERWDPFTRKYDQPDLAFPLEPQPFGRGVSDVMFKPEGDGRFPALVIMPTCANVSSQTHDWAERALAHGYAALIVDPLSPRGERWNCAPPSPIPVPVSRLLKDAFDAANHLRRQPFVDPARVGLLGFSQGANVGVGASGETYSRFGGSQPFRAIVSLYPSCVIRNFALPGLLPTPVDIHYVPARIVVPLLVEIGDQDNESGDPMGNCPPLLDQQNAQGAPVHYIIYHATHVWDQRDLTPADAPHVYSPDVTEQSVKDAFAFFDEQMQP
jgi:dienelactone hydrolase